MELPEAINIKLCSNERMGGGTTSGWEGPGEVEGDPR